MRVTSVVIDVVAVVVDVVAVDRVVAQGFEVVRTVDLAAAVDVVFAVGLVRRF